MRTRHWGRLLVVVSCLSLMVVPARAQGFDGAYDRGYREGMQQAQEDLREGRNPQPERSREYRDADNGYQQRYGSRDVYRNNFRRGFLTGYRTGYDRSRGAYDRRDGRRFPTGARGYSEPAFARGYSDGWEKGLDDGRDRDRYDPARHGDYRDADDGYSRSYGSKDAYQNNYRSGFRQGYEDGYRDGARRRG